MTTTDDRSDPEPRTWRVAAQYLDRPHDTLIHVGLLESNEQPRISLAIGNDAPVTLEPDQAQRLRGRLLWVIHDHIRATIHKRNTVADPHVGRRLLADGTPAEPLPPAPGWAATSERCDGGMYYERRPQSDVCCHDIDEGESVIPADVRLSTYHLPADDAPGGILQCPPQISIRGHADATYLDIDQAAHLRDALTELIDIYRSTT